MTPNEFEDDLDEFEDEESYHGDEEELDRIAYESHCEAIHDEMHDEGLCK